MIAYKLIRKMKDGYSPLFINKRLRMRTGIAYQAKTCPTKGFALRSGWHCTLKPVAPHLKQDIDGRVWVRVRLDGPVIKYSRPDAQGGLWLLCTGTMTILNEV